MLRHRPGKLSQDLSRHWAIDKSQQDGARPSYRRAAYLRLVLFAACFLLVASVIIDLLSGSATYVDSSSVETLTGLDAHAKQQSISTIRSNTTLGKITMIYGDTMPAFERALALQEMHNARWGYSMFVLRSKTLPQFWSKPAYILKVLLDELEKPESARLQWLVWVDADVVLLNQQIALDIFLPPHDQEINCLVTNDLHGLNNGVFFLRVHEWSVWLMSAVLSTKVYQPTLKLKWGDQSALERQLATEQFANQTRHVPQRWFNAFPGHRGKPDPDPLKPPDFYEASSAKEGDLHVHFVANRAVRERRMSLWLDVAEAHKAPWEIPLENTTYPKEISDYWKKQAAKEIQPKKHGLEN